jgi:hypothetical protein
MYCCCSGCNVLGVKRCTGVSQQEAGEMVHTPSQDIPIPAPRRNKKLQMRRNSNKRAMDDKYDSNSECLVIVRAASNSSLQTVQTPQHVYEECPLELQRTSLSLSPGYEQYQMSLLAVPWPADYGEASSDDLSSEWDSDVADTPSEQLAAAKVLDRPVSLSPYIPEFLSLSDHTFRLYIFISFWFLYNIHLHTSLWRISSQISISRLRILQVFNLDFLVHKIQLRVCQKVPFFFFFFFLYIY